MPLTVHPYLVVALLVLVVLVVLRPFPALINLALFLVRPVVLVRWRVALVVGTC